METALVITEASRRAIQSRGADLSRELKQAARRARRNHLPILYRASTIVLGLALVLRNNLGRELMVSYVVMVLIPSLLFIGYCSLVVSSQYSSEAKFAVRTGERSILDSVTTAGIASLQQAQDTLIVADYVKNRALVEELDRRINLRAMFSSPDIDYFSRFKSNGTIEDLTRYWRNKIHISIEYSSGIVTIETYAFSPEEALKLSQIVVTMSENLINTMSNRAQHDLVAQAERELTRAEDRLRQATATLTTLRNREGLLDPRQQADAIGKLVNQLKLDRLNMDQEVTSLTQSLSEQSPQVRLLRLRMKATTDQIARLESRLTNEKKGDTSAISGSITRFDEVELERQVAEKQYFLTSASLETARIMAERQRLYLAAFVRPVLAHESLYPNRVLLSFLGVIGIFIFWAVCIGLWMAFRSRPRARLHA